MGHIARTIKQFETPPEAYPEAPEGMSETSAAMWPVAWARIEAYTSWRWPAREVEWRVEGPGDWTPPLTPVAIDTVEAWLPNEKDWAAFVDIEPSPYGGFVFDEGGAYRIIATVGDDDLDVPAVVTEAVRRLAEYMAAKPGKPGATSERIEAGSISLAHSRDAAWMAKAIDNSGAGDLLRSFRRA